MWEVIIPGSVRGWYVKVGGGTRKRVVPKKVVHTKGHGP